MQTRSIPNNGEAFGQLKENGGQPCVAVGDGLDGKEGPTALDGLDVKILVAPGSFLGDFKSYIGERFLVNSVFRVDFTLHDRTGILVAKLAHLFALLHRVAFATATYMVNIIHMAPCNESL